ncbi:MAG: hypothetical protein ACOX0E_07470 [Syntrophomonadaceae bacterium]|jgi:hypothetical protein
MRDYLGAVLFGAMLGVVGSVWVLRNENEIKKGSRQIKARIKRTKNRIMDDHDEEADNLLGGTQ